MLAEWSHRRRPTALGVASGAIAGLVAITPAAGFVAPMPAIVIGLAAGGLCYAAVNLKFRLGYDDSLDAVGVHGVGGAWGAVATGLFASPAINALVPGTGLLAKQLVSIGAAAAYAFAVSVVLLRVLDAAMGLRVGPEAEYDGLDLTQHGEVGYTL